MKIGIVPFYEGLSNNKLFDIKDDKLNADNMLTPYYEIREKLEVAYTVNTVDMYENLADIDCALFFRLDYSLLIRCIKQNINKIVYFAWEPEVVEYRHSASYLRKIEPFFDVIMTWNDTLVDNVKYYKINYPYHFESIMHVCKTEDFNTKKLLVNISGYKHSSHNNELYSERLKVIEYYERMGRSDFELYGRGWPKNMKCFRGECLRKSDVYKQFKFALCLENMCNVSGYITEKLFDCFSAGIVPIYWGADNIEKYIPQGCYIDYRKFNDIQHMDEFISSISYQEYAQYIDNINAFMNSKQKDEFTSSFFCAVIRGIMQKEAATFSASHIWWLYIYNIYHVFKEKIKKMAMA